MHTRKFKQHRDHQMHINWALTNAHGNPALCCSQCTTPKGPRKGQSLYIDWLNTRSIQVLKDIGVEERF